MRQSCSERTVHKIRLKTGLPVAKVMVRGGTDHRKDLWLEDGSLVYLWRDGTIETLQDYKKREMEDKTRQHDISSRFVEAVKSYRQSGGPGIVWSNIFGDRQ